MVLITAALPEHDSQQRERAPLLQHSEDSPAPLIQSEIVIVDDDGTEEPFDPASWFS
ncbi:hypothetical protein ABZX74_05415 [Streptomyces olivaceoviridis]|uniref:hypothetical protein n=1 Tax=Streptomyces olivaceoviridis TaxID=1921 RepID=UPI0033A72F7A